MIFITHDIDWISPLHPFSIAKSFTHGDKWLKLNKVFQHDIFIKHIDKLIRFNEQHHVYAIWLTGAPQRHSFQKFGLRYTADCPTYSKVINKLKEADCEIGLHSVNTELFSHQFNALSNLTQRPVKYHRSHFLKYDEKLLYTNLHQHGIKTDFSLGNARKIEIPTNIPHITYGANCVPTVLFDNAFFFNEPATVFTRFKQVLVEAQAAGMDIAILFHPENFAVKPELWDYYEEVISQVQQLNKHLPKQQNIHLN